MTDTPGSAGEVPAGYPEGRYPDRRGMGQFDALQVAPFHVVAEDQLVNRKYFGLRHTDTFVDLLVATSSGQFYMIYNNVKSSADGTLSASTLVGGVRSSGDGLVADVRYEPWSGIAIQTRTPSRIVYSIPDLADPEEVTFGADNLEWTSERGGIRLAGELAGNGTQWHHGWRRPDGETGEMFYTQQGYSVSGSYLGEPVTGHVVIETMWGNEHYPETWWVQNRVGHWAMFAINYDDGSSEYGQFLCGEYGARGAIVTDQAGRAVVQTTNINAVEEPDGRVSYQLGNGEKWEFVADLTRSLDFPGTKLRSGAARRVDEARTILTANGSHFIARRLPPARAFT
jgi:hypothetical protein